jgi:hypothetical protein
MKKFNSQKGLLKESHKELFLNEAPVFGDSSKANNPGWYIEQVQNQVKVRDGEYDWRSNTTGPDQYENRTDYQLKFVRPNNEWFARGLEVSDDDWAKMRNKILDPKSYLSDFYETGEEHSEKNFMRWPGFKEAVAYIGIVDNEKTKNKKFKEEQDAAKKSEEAVNAAKKEIINIQGYLKDPDNQGEEEQNELKDLLKQATEKFPAIQKLSMEIKNLEEKLQNAQGLEKFETKNALKKAIQSKQSEIEKMLSDLEQIEKQAGTISENVKIKRWQKLAGIL